jgi:hypothetical protein
MSIEGEGGTMDMVNLDAYTAPAPEPAKPKRLSKKTREALQREFQRGYDEGFNADRGAEMLGSVGLIVICLLMGGGLGAWLF